MRVHCDDCATAFAAAKQTAQEGARLGAGTDASTSTTWRTHACARRSPQRLVDNAQLRPFDRLPFGRRTHQALAFSGIRILEPLTAVPDIAAAIELFVQDATTLARRTVDRGYRPGATSRGVDALAVELGRHPLAAPSARIMFKNPTPPAPPLQYQSQASDHARRRSSDSRTKGRRRGSRARPGPQTRGGS